MDAGEILPVAVAAAVLSGFGLLYTIYRNHVLDKRLKASEADGKASKQKLAEIEARGKAPYLTTSTGLIGNAFHQEDDGSISMFPAVGSNVLSTRNRVVVGLAKGDPVVLVLENQGADARRIRIVTDLKEASLRQEPEIDGAHGYTFLLYEYEPDKQGQRVKIELSFESHDGYQGAHTYETKHGEFYFVRTHPA
jgi:hypothetical protein